MPRGRGRAGTVLLAALFAGSVLFALVGCLIPADGSSTFGASFSPPGTGHPLGTDSLGRDVFARLLHGGAQLLGVSVLSTIASTVVGVAWGIALAGKGIPKTALSAVADLFVVMPSVLVMMVLVFGLGSGVATMVLVTIAVSAPFTARYTRSMVGPVLRSGFVESSRLSGDPLWKTVMFDVLPCVALPIATDAGLRFISAVYLVSSAAFMGFDPLGSASDWGTMIQSGLDGLSLNPWAAIAPCIALACITVSGNLLIDRIGKGRS